MSTLADKTIEILRECPLFAGCDGAVRRAAGRGEILAFDRGAEVDFSCGKLFVVLSGLLQVSSNDVILNTLGKGSVTGVTGLFGSGSQTEPRTAVKAVRPSRVLALAEGEVRALIETDPEFASSYIGFLTDRLRFLNRRMAYFTAQSIQKRLAGYLLDVTTEDNPAVSVNMSRLAGFLNVGRASLYRTLEALVREGTLKKESSSIVVLSQEALRKL